MVNFFSLTHFFIYVQFPCSVLDIFFLTPTVKGLKVCLINN